MSNTNKNVLIAILAFGFIVCLSILAFADIGIYCHLCREHIYDYQGIFIDKGVELKAKDFKPSNITIPQPEESNPMVCPYDNAPLNGYEYIFWKKGFRLPLFRYPAYSLLSKDGHGDWAYVPFPMPEMRDE